MGWTPHSPRIAFASELVAAGVRFTEVRERGRYIADSSLRTYIDVASAAGISAALRLSGLAEAIALARGSFLDFFPAAKLHCKEAKEYGRQGFSEGTRRSDVSALGLSIGARACGLPQTIPCDEDGNPSTVGLEGVVFGTRMSKLEKECQRFDIFRSWAGAGARPRMQVKWMSAATRKRLLQLCAVGVIVVGLVCAKSMACSLLCLRRSGPPSRWSML